MFHSLSLFPILNIFHLSPLLFLKLNNLWIQDDFDRGINMMWLVGPKCRTSSGSVKIHKQQSILIKKNNYNYNSHFHISNYKYLYIIILY